METAERILANQRLMSQPSSNSLDALNWEEVGGELDRQRIADWSAQPATVAPVEAERAALDQTFAQTADETDLVVDD
jgi:hypothetical protein